MKRSISYLIISIFLLISIAAPVLAIGQADDKVANVVINEIQANGPGGGTTDQEFIELKNIGGQAADISGWKLQYVPSTGNLAAAKYFFAFPTNTVVYPDGYLLVAANSYLAELTPRFEYTINTSFSGLAAAGATVRLTNAIDVVMDTVGWGTKTTIVCETTMAAAPVNGESIERIMVNGLTADTDDNSKDFGPSSLATPQTANINPEPIPEPTPEPTIEPTPEPTVEPTPTPVITPTPEPTPEPTIEPTPEPIPEPTPGQAELPILLNELFIDPSEPLSDSQDEWTEIYNPNDEAVDLLGYGVYVGSTFSYKQVFTQTTIVEPRGYLTITSGDSNLSLSNSGGAAKIVGPSGQIFDQTTYAAAKEDIAWAKGDDGQWTWTTTPTKNEANLITSLPEPIQKAAAAASVQKSTASSVKKAVIATPKPSPTPKTVTKVKAATDTSSATAGLVSPPSPLPAWLLAILGVLAVIYALYEYRFELSNKLYQLREHRENRLTNRQ